MEIIEQEKLQFQLIEFGLRKTADLNSPKKSVCDERQHATRTYLGIPRVCVKYVAEEFARNRHTSDDQPVHIE